MDIFLYGKLIVPHSPSRHSWRQKHEIQLVNSKGLLSSIILTNVRRWRWFQWHNVSNIRWFQRHYGRERSRMLGLCCACLDCVVHASELVFANWSSQSL